MRVAAVRALMIGLAAVVALLGGACREEDPLAARLARRTYYSVEISTFSPRDDGRLLVELTVKAGMGPRLSRLTVTIRQHAADESELRRDRVTLDLSAMDATGVLRVFTEVPAADPAGVEAVSVLVERDPPASEYGEFPEIQEVAGG